MHRLIAIVCIAIMMLSLSAQVSAQDDDCGDGIPCGQLPDSWRLPALPALESPTPLPTRVISDDSSLPGGPTPTPTPTPTPPLNTGELQDFIATAQAEYEATEESIVNFEGTPIAPGGISDLVPASDVNFWSYVKGLPITLETITGPFSTTVSLLIAYLLISILLGSNSFILTMLAPVFGLIRKLWNMIPFT